MELSLRTLTKSRGLTGARWSLNQTLWAVLIVSGLTASLGVAAVVGVPPAAAASNTQASAGSVVSASSSSVVSASGGESENAASDQFVDGFEDLPLMPGLSQEPDAMTAFDSPYGRIVESYASGHGSVAKVRHFYQETLPQLGWKKMSEHGKAEVFQREGEDLTVEVTQKGTAVTVRFQSSPH